MSGRIRTLDHQVDCKEAPGHRDMQFASIDFGWVVPASCFLSLMDVDEFALVTQIH